MEILINIHCKTERFVTIIFANFGIQNVLSFRQWSEHDLEIWHFLSEILWEIGGTRKYTEYKRDSPEAKSRFVHY